ncbi:hypothetical protein TWF730_011237 [Orbilia blumenaviensis]|uniref:Uncharacterized protein n=1 Tax=Orbilia blumenaviensis TaxID=1796055 RepID=A0AAV9UJR6_9PEZI
MSTGNQEFLADGSVRWILSTEERQSIASLLGTEENTLANVRGNIMNRARATCSCGKHSGLDDLVQNATAAGIHTKDFMLKVLIDGPQEESPAHGLQCSNCSKDFDGLFRWAGFWED